MLPNFNKTKKSEIVFIFDQFRVKKLNEFRKKEKKNEVKTKQHKTKNKKKFSHLLFFIVTIATDASVFRIALLILLMFSFVIG